MVHNATSPESSDDAGPGMSSVDRTEQVQPAAAAMQVPATDGPAAHLELREERLRIDKQTIEAGAVRIGKRVTEWTETIEVPLRREDLVIEVLPGSGAVHIEGNELQPGDTFELPLLCEQATVTKETVISEDVRIRKVSAEVSESVSEALRREELVVEERGDLEVRDGSGGAVPLHATARR